MNNQRQVGVAATLYSSDHEGIVIADNFGNKFFFANHYSKYVGGPDIAQNNNAAECADYFEAIPAFQCPAGESAEIVLDWTVNSTDFPLYEDQGIIDNDWTTNTDNLPDSPTNIVYLMEANRFNNDFINSSFGGWDVKGTSQFTFNPGGGTNLNPRSMSALDFKHFGKQNLSFFDGHSETRMMKAGSMPFQLINPSYP